MVKRIADGSFGMVYQMQNKITRDLVAAKRLKHRKPEDVYFSRKEVHILNKIAGGPGVVNLIDYFESPSQSVIIIEYLEGKQIVRSLPATKAGKNRNLARYLLSVLMS